MTCRRISRGQDETSGSGGERREGPLTFSVGLLTHMDCSQVIIILFFSFSFIVYLCIAFFLRLFVH